MDVLVHLVIDSVFRYISEENIAEFTDAFMLVITEVEQANGHVACRRGEQGGVLDSQSIDIDCPLRDVQVYTELGLIWKTEQHFQACISGTRVLYATRGDFSVATVEAYWERVAAKCSCSATYPAETLS